MMAGDEAVLNFLEVSELDSIPLPIRNKLEEVFLKNQSEKDDLKNKYEKLRVNSEQQYFDVEKQLFSSINKLEVETASLTELQQKHSKLVICQTAAEIYVKLQQKYSELEQKYKDLSDKHSEVSDAQEGRLSSQLQLARSNEQLEAEKRDLTLLLEKRNKEIERLNEEWKELTSKVSKANTAKCEAQAKLSDIQSSMVTLEFQQKRAQQENAHMKGQMEWLNKELSDKTKELMNIRKDQASKLIDIQTQLEEKTDDCKQLKESLEAMRKTNSDQAQRIDKLIQKNKDVCESQIQSEEQFRQEVEAKSKLADLYKKSSDEAESKVKELSRAIEELQKLLKESADGHTDMEKQKQELIDKLYQEISERENNIRKLKEELERANDLILEARKKNMTNEQVESMFPSAAATSKYVKTGMTLTEIYNSYVNASDELLLEKQESKRLQQYIDNILQEIEEKAPILKQQREDYENSLYNIEQLTKQLDSSLLENQTLQSEADESIRKYNHMQRENRKYQQQVLDLSHQVQFLIKEIEELKGRRIIREEDRVSSTEISSSSEAISSRLVTFRDVEEMQTQNQRMLAVIRELSEKKEEEEKLATEAKTEELKNKLQMAHNELKELKDARSRQAEMVEAIVKQRDMYKVLAQQEGQSFVSFQGSVLGTPMPGKGMGSAMKSPIATVKSPSVEKNIEESRHALKQISEDFANYKKEKCENERILTEQVDKSRQELADIRVQNAKLSSQLDFQAERYKVLIGNNEGYKTEIASLRDKCQKYSTSVAKHEQTINILRQDAMSAKENLARAEAQRDNSKMEKEHYKSSEGRLLQELESLRRDRHSQSLLMANLQAIQNNLERSEFDTRTRYTNKIDSLEMEVSSMKRKLKAEEDEHKALNLLFQKETKSLRSQLEQSLKEHEHDKTKLTNLEKDYQHLKVQTAETVLKLRQAEQTLASRGNVQAAPVVQSNTAAQEEIKDLQSALDLSEKKIGDLKEQLKQLRDQKDQFKAISDGLQKTVAENSNVVKEYEQHQKKTLEEKERLEQELQQHRTEIEDLKNENSRLSEESHNLNADLRKQLVQVQKDLQDAVERREVALCNEMVAVEESSDQKKIADEARDHYQKEVILHAADLEALTTVKRQLDEFNTKLSTEKDLRAQAERKLEEYMSSSSERNRLSKVEIERMEQRCKDLDNQNKLLHDQMEKMSKEALSVQAAVTRRDSLSLNTSFSEEGAKSSEQLLDVIKYLRKEKEIAESKFEVVQAEMARVKQRNDLLHKEIEEVNKTLSEEREQTQATLQTAAQHADTMKKVENLNLLMDSNQLLRSEKEKLQQEIETVEAKVRKLEGDINPMMQTVRERQVTIDTLGAEKNALKNEVDRWKARTNHLIEQANRSDPEEKKKLIQERENVKKELTNMTEENHRLKAEVSRSSQNLQNAQKEIGSLKDEKGHLTQEINKLKTETEEVKQNLQTAQDQVEEKSREIDEKQKTIFQLKKIGRKYKEQAEIMGKELDDANKKLTELEQQPSAGAIEQATSALREQLSALEKERDELKGKVEQAETGIETVKEQELKQRQKLQEDYDKLREDFTKVSEEKGEHERKVNQSKQVLLTARKKINSQTEEIQNQARELENMRKRISTAGETLNATEERLKSEYETRITSLEKELSEVKEVAAASGQIGELKNNIEKLEKEKSEQQAKINEQQTKIAELQTKIQQLQKQPQPKAVAPKTQVARPSPTVVVEGTSIQPAEGPPPKTAPIRPIPSPVARAHPTPSQSQANMKATASIRPMPSPLSVAVATPTATVMPTTVTHQEHQEEGIPAAQISPVTATRPTQQVQRVIPQQDLSEQSTSEAESTSQPETVVVEPQHQQLSVGPQTTMITPLAQQVSTTITTTLVQPTVQPSTSSGISREGATKRTREDSVEDETEAKRSKVTQHQEAQILPTIVVSESAEVTQQSTQPLLDTSSEEQTQTNLPDTQTEPDSSQTQNFTEEVEEEQGFDINEQDQEAETGEAETGDQSGEGEEDDEDGIIILEDEDNEESAEEDEGEYEEEGQEEGEEAAEEENDGEDIYADMDDYAEGQEGEPINEEEYQEEGEMDEEEYAHEDMQEDQGEDDDDGDPVVIIESDDEEEESGMEAQEEETPPTTQAVTASIQPVMVQQQAQPIERQTSVTRTQLTPFIIGGQGYEDGEDGIVPSTPTLYIPMRGDGFAEAISSPMVGGQRFTFGLSSSESQPDLAQLESQRASGMDDCCMDLSQLQEGGGRSVPSTPHRTTAPVSIGEASLSSLASTSQGAPEVSSSQASVPETEDSSSVQDVPTTKTTEGEKTESEPQENTEDNTTGEQVEAQPGPSTEFAHPDGATGTKDDSGDKTDVSGKPKKIEPITWDSKTNTSSATPQQFHTRPPRRGQPPYRGQNQQRGRGQFQRGRSPVQRATRGPSRGNRGGMFRSPNMY